MAAHGDRAAAPGLPSGPPVVQHIRQAAILRIKTLPGRDGSGGRGTVNARTVATAALAQSVHLLTRQATHANQRRFGVA